MQPNGFGQQSKKRPSSSPRLRRTGTIGDNAEVSLYLIPRGMFDYSISKLRQCNSHVVALKPRNGGEARAFAGEDLAKVKQALENFVKADVVIVST